MYTVYFRFRVSNLETTPALDDCAMTQMWILGAVPTPRW